ncbi:MAG: FAD-dependent oxidoreductase, partial [Eubacteriales bacterium]|nr:FAD-dependent oxidoreductase [Eubacteriales bacterium]
MKTIIVGGVAGGASAAARLRRLDEDMDIVLLERGEHISYANCGLPYYIGGEITDRDELTLMTPESFRRRFRVDVRVQNEAVAIDPKRRVVTIKDDATGNTYEETYDKLILSPGAEPVRPPLPGIDDRRVFTLRTIPDTFAIHDYIAAAKPRRAVVV